MSDIDDLIKAAQSDFNDGLNPNNQLELFLRQNGYNCNQLDYKVTNDEVFYMFTYWLHKNGIKFKLKRKNLVTLSDVMMDNRCRISDKKKGHVS